MIESQCNVILVSDRRQVNRCSPRAIFGPAGWGSHLGFGSGSLTREALPGNMFKVDWHMPKPNSRRHNIDTLSSSVLCSRECLGRTVFINYGVMILLQTIIVKVQSTRPIFTQPITVSLYACRLASHHRDPTLQDQTRLRILTRSILQILILANVLIVGWISLVPYYCSSYMTEPGFPDTFQQTLVPCATPMSMCPSSSGAPCLFSFLYSFRSRTLFPCSCMHRPLPKSPNACTRPVLTARFVLKPNSRFTHDVASIYNVWYLPKKFKYKPVPRRLPSLFDPSLLLLLTRFLLQSLSFHVLHH